MASNYWEQRILADERRATEIAQRASEEMAKMYRAQYLRVVKEIDKLKAQIDYGKPLTRTQLWNYARWSKVEESLKGFVTETVTIDTQVIHDAINAEFERVIGKPASDYGGALGRRGTISMTRSETPWVSESDKVGLPRLKSKISGAAPGLEKNRILSGDWSGEHYSARVWKNTSAIADRMRNEITNMLVDGKSTQDIRRAVMREFGVSYNNADRLVRTEVSYVHNQMTLARYKEDGDTLVKILIVEDGKACEICRELPGKPYDINAAPFLPAHPRCRCCYAPWTYSDRKRWAEEHPEEEPEGIANRPEIPGSSEKPEEPLETIEMTRRKIGKRGQEIIDKPTYNKLTRAFLRHGGIIVRGEDAERHLGNWAYASYVAEVNVAFIRDDATVSDVLEEMYHAKQQRRGDYADKSPEESYLRREIDAQKYLQSAVKKYKIPMEEQLVTQRNLVYYVQELKELLETEG